MVRRQFFISVKDHKENFKNTLKCRLINPAKRSFGFVSKTILGRINHRNKQKKIANKWRNTANVVEWFTNGNNKNNFRFFVFDKVYFHSSVSEKLLTLLLDYAREFTEVSDEDFVIVHVRSSLIMNDNEKWIKEGDPLMFDVTTGSLTWWQYTTL